MKIIRIHKKPKSEDKYIYPFLMFYCRDEKRDIGYKAISERTEFKTPDYRVSPTDVLVEIKEVHDAKDKERSARWGKIVDNLRKEIKKNNKLTKINGLYSINTPSNFKFPTDKKQIEEAADSLLGSIIQNKTGITLHKVDFNFEKVSDKGGGVYFSASGLGGSFDPASTINENISDKLATANKQLGFKLKNLSVNKRIVLLTNHYPLLHWNWDLYKALSFSYGQLLTYKNIDEIWFQNPNKNSTFTHKLLYTKKFLSGYHNRNLNISEENALLFSNWFSALEKLGDEHKNKLFDSLKRFLNKDKAEKWFKDNVGAREEMVRLGNWLVENKRLDDAVGLIDKFIDDPSPKEPKNYIGDPDFNYHQQILDGKDPSIITTVLGHLAWTIQKLASRRKEKNKRYTTKSLEYAQKLIEHKNYYVKLQAIVSLIEIAKRRQWLTGWGKRPRKEEYKQFHQVVFSLIKLIEDNPKCVAIAKWLCNVLAYYKDLSTKEALRVLDALQITDESAGLLVYYTIYRKHHYQNQPIKFESEKFEEKLKKIIESKSQKNQTLKSNVAWHLWKTLDENKNEFINLKDWISLFVKQKYNRKIYGTLLRIIEDWIDKESDISITWYETLINNIHKEINTEAKARNFWFSNRTGQILNIIAEKKPEKLKDLVEKLVILWKLGSFIGSPKKVFESYKKISDKGMRQATKKRFSAWYQEMKKLNPKLEKVDWT